MIAEDKSQATKTSKRMPNFSIDNILRPEFGKSKTEDNEKQLEKDSVAEEQLADNSQEKLMVSHLFNIKSQKLKSIPAWIYCTRYSDRPNSGKKM